ncbi:MAG: FtsX-like permease family protein [Ruminococcaceae bacterium]|nr:FtsX-like permease family protein [Oscillospiraceae bacterium]
MKKISLKYSIAGCLKVFVRSPIMALAALCLLGGSLLIFSFTYAVTHNIDAISENEGNVCIFLSDECDETAVSAVRDSLAKLTTDGTVSEIDYLSKTEALENEKQRYPEYSKLFSTFTPENSPFKASFTVSVNDDTGYLKVKNTIKDLELEKVLEDGTVYKYDPIDSVYDDGEAITEIEKAGDKLVGALGIIIPLMLVVCIVLISAVVRMGIFDKRDEISLMRIIGATHTYISAQFVFEGLTLGLLSSLLAIISLRPVYNALISKIAQSVKLFTPLAFSEIAPGVIVLCILFGLLAGLLGSLIATSRYIRRD